MGDPSTGTRRNELVIEALFAAAHVPDGIPTACPAPKTLKDAGVEPREEAGILVGFVSQGSHPRRTVIDAHTLEVERGGRADDLEHIGLVEDRVEDGLNGGDCVEVR